MPDETHKPAGKQIAAAVQRVLERDTSAVLITLIAAPTNIGAKLLVEESGTIAGSLGDPVLDAAAARHAAAFLDKREEVRSLKVRTLQLSLLAGPTPNSYLSAFSRSRAL